MKSQPARSLPSPAPCALQICVSNGLPNSKVTVLKPNKVQVIIPGVDDKEQIGALGWGGPGGAGALACKE